MKAFPFRKFHQPLLLYAEARLGEMLEDRDKQVRSSSGGTSESLHSAANACANRPLGSQLPLVPLRALVRFLPARLHPPSFPDIPHEAYLPAYH